MVLIRGDEPTGLCLQSAERGNSKLDSNQEHASPDRQYERIQMKHQFHHEPSLEHTTQESQDQNYGVATVTKEGCDAMAILDQSKKTKRSMRK